MKRPPFESCDPIAKASWPPGPLIRVGPTDSAAICPVKSTAIGTVDGHHVVIQTDHRWVQDVIRIVELKHGIDD